MRWTCLQTPSRRYLQAWKNLRPPSLSSTKTRWIGTKFSRSQYCFFLLQISNIHDDLSKCPRLRTLRLEENCLSLAAIPTSLLKSAKIMFYLHASPFPAKINFHFSNFYCMMQNEKLLSLANYQEPIWTLTSSGKVVSPYLSSTEISLTWKRFSSLILHGDFTL